MVDTPKVEFAVGSEVSHASFYKSAFARSFAINSRETKSLDFGFVNKHPETIAEEPNSLSTNSTTNDNNRKNNFLHFNGAADIKLWRINEKTADVDAATTELDKLRKECQNLAEENRRLQGALATGRISHSRVIDNVLLQSQVDTLQWQLKQTEANRQMYRALMGQVVRFLERAHKSLEILHEKSNPKSSKTGSGAPRVPRSRSVHAVEGSSSSPNRNSMPGPTNSFARAKSVTQISGGGGGTPNAATGINVSGGGGGGGGGSRDSTSSVWSVLRRTEVSASGGLQSRGEDAVVVYRRRPKQSENNPDEVPADRLSQEAFRLLRTVQSLLATREPDLARVQSEGSGEDCRLSGSPPPLPNFTSACSNSNIATSGTAEISTTNSTDHDTGGGIVSFRKPESGSCLLPGARRSLDATSIHSSGSSKTTETTEEDDVGILDRDFPTSLQSSTPNRRCKNPSEPEPRFKPKPPASVSSAEDESGFSSMSSFQDVGLPAAPSPVKGCHTEVGLPEVPVSKVRHRRWSSTPAAEIQALLNARANNSGFANANVPSEALKVLWV